MTAVIVVVSVLAYLALGSVLALRSVPALWDRALKQKMLDGLGHYAEQHARDYVLGGVVAGVLLWPLLAPYELLLVRRVDALNPRAVERRDREQRTRIQELERELGIR